MIPLDEETVTTPAPCSQKNLNSAYSLSKSTNLSTLTDFSKYSFCSAFSIVTVAEPFTVS